MNAYQQRPYRQQPKALAQTSDVLLTVKGAGVGKCNLAIDAAIGRQVMALRPHPDVLDREYLLEFLRAHESRINALGQGATVPGIGLDDVAGIRLPLPSISEQRRLAGLLAEAGAIRRKRREALNLTTELLRSAFLDVFGEPVTNARGWPVLKVGSLFPAHRAGARCGPFGSALKKNEYESSGIPVWGIDNVLPDRFVEGGSLFISEPKFESLQAYAVADGDILISRAGTVGRMCVARPLAKRSIIGTNLIRVSLDSARMIPEYFTMLLTLFGSEITRLKANPKENAYSFLNTGALKELEIPVPDMQAQRSFFTWVEHVRRVRARMEIARSDGAPVQRTRAAHILRRAAIRASPAVGPLTSSSPEVTCPTMIELPTRLSRQSRSSLPTATFDIV